MTNKNRLLSAVNMSWLIAYCLVAPTYLIFFIGKEPVMQGLAFSLYLIPILVIAARCEYVTPSKAFIVTWILFLILWIIPSLINWMSARLESDLVSLPILAYHATLLTILVLTLTTYLQKDPKDGFEKLIRSIFWVMVPMSLLIIVDTFYLSILSPTRPRPFDIHPNVAGEIILTIMLTALWLRNVWLKALVVILSITTAYLLESRGTLISCYIGVIVAFVYPWIKQHITNHKMLVIFAGLIFVMLLFHETILLRGAELFMIDFGTDGFAGRGAMYQLAINGIIDRPILGNGFWVNPMGYSLPEQVTPYLNEPANVIHNAFLRIASENGLGLTILILSVIGIATYKLIRGRAYTELAVLCACLFFLMFATRHLTLNLMNILLYFVLIRSLVIDKNYKKID